MKCLWLERFSLLICALKGTILLTFLCVPNVLFCILASKISDFPWKAKCYYNSHGFGILGIQIYLELFIKLLLESQKSLITSDQFSWEQFWKGAVLQKWWLSLFVCLCLWGKRLNPGTCMCSRSALHHWTTASARLFKSLKLICLANVWKGLDGLFMYHNYNAGSQELTSWNL